MSGTPPREPAAVTRLLAEASGGDRSAMDRLFPLVYDELKAISRARLRREREGHTLNATALVHEAYLALVEQDRVEWQSRAHFFAVASLAMRRILISYARARLSEKRGGGQAHVPLDDVAGSVESPDVLSPDEATELVALDDALGELETFNPQGAEVVQYRFFGGLEHREIAEVTGVSEVTVRRRWTAAKTWLRGYLDPGLVDRTTSLLRPARAGG
ncbi:MAG: sigma-70 family RNA polymerase sigma factor [Longimicrobiales bacterium]